MPQSYSQLAPYVIAMLFAFSTKRSVLVSGIIVSLVFNGAATIVVIDAFYTNWLVQWEAYPVAGSMMIFIQFAALLASLIVLACTKMMTEK
jgi:hypothetical protein